MMSLIVNLATLVGAAIALHQFFIRKLNPGHLVFVEDASIELFSTIIKRFPEIKVRYRGNAVKSNLVLFVGSIINRGAIDIQPMADEDKLQIQVPSGFRWVMARAIRRSPSLKVSASAGGQSLVFNFGLLKKREVFQFEAICEVDEEFSPSFFLSKVMRFHHRIPQTGSVTKVRSVPRSELARMARDTKFSLLLLPLLFALGLSLVSFDYFFDNSAILYRYESKGKSVLVRAFPERAGKIHVKGFEVKFEKDIAPGEIANQVNLVPVVGKESYAHFLMKWFDRFEYIILFVAIQGLVPSSIYHRHYQMRLEIWETTESVPSND